jgi:phosphopantothenoylcysteine decarboxylase/phosphopantothenate--cysteine ligase
MNQQMWQSRITQENAERLQQRGVKILGPASGSQACGETGTGRMLDPLELVQFLQNGFKSGPLQGKKVLITAGPTREDIDPVRFISNRSSGRMGYAIATAAATFGAEVTLISGPVSLSPPQDVQTLSVYSSQEMYEAVMARISTSDIFIAAAAVADYRPVQQAIQKIKKNEAHLQLSLERTPDILAQVANLATPPFTVGFAAETEHLADYARSKLEKKKLNMIAANLVGIEGIGFDSEENALSVFWADGCIEFPKTSKKVLANQLVEIIIMVNGK